MAGFRDETDSGRDAEKKLREQTAVLVITEKQNWAYPRVGFGLLIEVMLEYDIMKLCRGI